MNQDDINSLLAEALDRAEERMNELEETIRQRDQIINLMVDQLETLTNQISGALEETMAARQQYAKQRQKLGLSYNFDKGSVSISETEALFTGLTQ